MGVDKFLDAGVADADADAGVVVAHRGGNGAQAVVAGIAAARLGAQFAGREVELVVQHDDVGEGDLVEPGGLRDGAAGFVHVGAGL